ncbi:hypothetical protein D2Q93_11335 [Alicyclobacillaceae bacterium I2511]|nr:hypothetical protein D2Q93_11335 [Alicyclobacillaceae bacterium I2511]
MYVLLYIVGVYAAKLSYAVTGATDAVAMMGVYGMIRWGGWQVWRLRVLLATLAAASVGAVTLAAANGWHQFFFPSAIGAAPQFDLASVFQYHNALGAFAGAVSMGLLVYTSLTRSRGLYATLLKGLLLGSASLDFAGLLLSGSRGALLFWVLMGVALFIFLRAPERDNRDRSRFLWHLYSLGVAGGIAYILLHKAIHTQSEGLGWTGLGLALALPVVAVLAAHWVSRQRDWTASRFSFPVLVVVGLLVGLAGAVVKHHSLLAKLHTYHLHQTSVIQRFIFWKDGLAIVVRNPLTGSGGGAWGAMWQKVESYPYYSTQVHSFIMDTLMNVGLIGLLALLGVVWTLGRSVLWPKGLHQMVAGTPQPLNPPNLSTHVGTAVNSQSSRRNSKGADESGAWAADRWEEFVGLRALAAIGLTLFLHAAMDWDMAFLSLLMVFTVGLAGSSELDRLSGLGASRMVQAAPMLKPGGAFRSPENWAMGLSGLAALGAVIVSGMAIQGTRMAQAAGTLPPAPRILALQTAHSFAPWSSSDLVQEEQAVEQATNSSPAGLQRGLQLLDEARQLNPYSAQIQGAAAVLAFQLGQFPEAYHRAMAAYHDAPYFATNLSTAINAAAVNGLESTATNWPVARQSFAQVLQLYTAYQHREAAVKSLPSYLPPLGPYQLDPFTYDSLAVSELALGNKVQARNFAQSAVPAQDPHTHQVAKLLLLLLNSPLGTHNAAVATYVNTHPGVKPSFALIQQLPNMR